MTLYKVKVGSAKYKAGIRWTECFEVHGRTETTQMVFDYILTISTIILMS